MKRKSNAEKYKKWLSANTESLIEKKVAITGSTGGLGKELSRYLVHLGASLILVDRNISRSEALKSELLAIYQDAKIKCITADMADINSVKRATELLKEETVDIFIHNAGAYSIPRKIASTGYDNVYQINFVSPYYMIRSLLPGLSERGGRVIVVGSIAHNYSRTDKSSIDFKDRKKASLVYGNAKRYLMFSMYGLFRNEHSATVSVTHPGITFTGITAHYPKLIFAIIKNPMKIIFMKPAKAALSILKGVFEPCEKNEWIGPRAFGVWGLPKKSVLKTVSDEEASFIHDTAESIYSGLLNQKQI